MNSPSMIQQASSYATAAAKLPDCGRPKRRCFMMKMMRKYPNHSGGGVDEE